MLRITVFEHQAVHVGERYGNQIFNAQHLAAFEFYHGDNGTPFFSLIHRGIKFNDHVGVIQVGRLSIEVLPKADKEDKFSDWRSKLIHMIRSVGLLNVHASSFSALSLKHNFILDAYLELFVNEVAFLLRKGLIKRYRRNQGQKLVLKGQLKLARHITENMIHQERFYTEHTVYDYDHSLNQILGTALVLVRRINSNTVLQSRINGLLLAFPNLSNIKVDQSTFDRITYTRKNKDYKDAIEIARLILLNYHPDIVSGKNNVLALMFNMNMLWERFLYISLYKHRPQGALVEINRSRPFWSSSTRYASILKPDIIITLPNQDILILDAKWKNLDNVSPSPADLRQLFTYHKYYNARNVALVYPGRKSKTGWFERTIDRDIRVSCDIMAIPVGETISAWQERISKRFFEEWVI